MTAGDRDLDERVEAAGEAALRAVFGDERGLVVFLAALSFFALYWRIGFFSTDSYAVANTMVAVADGHLHVGLIVYGPDSGITPGMYVVDGRLYGRNYGLVFAALPALLALRALAAVADLRLVIVGVWCLSVLSVVVFVGARAGRRERAMVLGSGAALCLFAANAVAAGPLDPYWLPLMALQLATMVAAAMIAVTLYRLLGRVHGRRVGLMAGVAAFLATPVGFWATIPKRHSATALLAIAVVYCFYRSRAADDAGGKTRFRAAAYAAVGLAAWVHAAEALVLLAALVPVDLLTARTNRPRALAAVAGAFVLSLVPFLVTNAAIAGDPFEPPRMLAPYAGAEGALSGGGAETADGAAPGGSGGTETTDGAAPGGSGGGSAAGTPDGVAGSGTGPIARIAGLVATVVGAVPVIGDRLGLFSDFLVASARSADPERLATAFVRSGYVDGLPLENDRAINLSVLESMPLLGALAAAPVAAWWRLGDRDGIGGPKLDAEGATDLLAIGMVALFVALYLHRLTAPHMLTVRYLHPIYPLGVYLLARLAVVRRAVSGEPRVAVGAYGTTVLVGTPAYVAGLALSDAVLSEAVQLYALGSLSVAAAVGAWGVAAAIRGDGHRAGAAVLGVAAGAMTVYLLVSGLGFFAFTDEFALPLSRAVAESLRFVNPLESLW